MNKQNRVNRQDDIKNKIAFILTHHIDNTEKILNDYYSVLLKSRYNTPQQLIAV